MAKAKSSAKRTSESGNPPQVDSSSSTKKGKKKKVGMRYSAETKAEVVQFVLDHNKTNNRGGQAAAVAKFGISQLTIGSWLKKAGSTSKIPRKGRGEAKSARGTTRNKPRSSVNTTSGLLTRMIELQQKIDALTQEYAALKARL